jgi:hypothetical protein
LRRTKFMMESTLVRTKPSWCSAMAGSAFLQVI